MSEPKKAVKFVVEILGMVKEGKCGDETFGCCDCGGKHVVAEKNITTDRLRRLILGAKDLAGFRVTDVKITRL